MNALLCDQDPTLAQKVGIMRESKEEDAVEEKTEIQESKPSGIEEQIKEIVDSFLNKHDHHIQMKLMENKADIIKEITEYRAHTSKEVESKIRTVEGYTQMIHNQVMQDLDSW